MSSSSPVSPSNPSFDPTIQFGSEPADFTTVFRHRHHDHDCGQSWPSEDQPAGQDDSPFPFGPNGDGGYDCRPGPIGVQPWSPFNSWPGESDGLPPGWGLNFPPDDQDSPPACDPDCPDQGGSGDGCQPTGGGHLTVDGNTISDGQYTIDASTADHGTITVTDKNNPTETFKVWGDPHITTGTGGTADFQHAPVTFKLPDGTEITVTPTDNPGVNTIDEVTVTSGNDAATITGFTSGSLDIDRLPGQGYHLDATTPDGTPVHAKDGNINDLVVGHGGPEIYKTSVGNIDRYAGLSVGGPGGNTVYDGRYTIVASDADKGTLTVTDNVRHETFTVWGDPHIKTSTGGTADFQHAPVTFDLPDGTEITVTPTDNTGPGSVNTINNVTITKGNDAVTITGFTSGHLDTDHRPGEGYWLDAVTRDGTVLHAKNGNIDDLVVGNGGPQIYKTDVGNIDRYACHPPRYYPPLQDFNPDALAVFRWIDRGSPSSQNRPDWWGLPDLF